MQGAIWRRHRGKIADRAAKGGGSGGAGTAAGQICRQWCAWTAMRKARQGRGSGAARLGRCHADLARLGHGGRWCVGDHFPISQSPNLPIFQSPNLPVTKFQVFVGAVAVKLAL